MTPEGDGCDLKQFLTMSFNGQAEEFTRSLQNKLRHLGSQEQNGISEAHWLVNKDNDTRLPEINYFNYNGENTNMNGHTNGDTNGHHCDTYDEDLTFCLECKTCQDSQDINDNGIEVINLANEQELCEELTEFASMNEVVEEINTNALDKADDHHDHDFEKVVYITDPNEHTVEYQLLKQNSFETTTNDEEENVRIPRIRRCSSLKTGKTPPGTPGRKKIVRFADVLGLDLADVRTFLDEIPKIPHSAYDDLINANIHELDVCCNSPPKCQRLLLALFRQPGGQPNFIERVTIGHVILENAVVEDPISLSIRGLIRVRNLDFDKSVHVRYSLDSWKSFSDLQATYVDNSSDGFTDMFSFLLYANCLSIGQKVEFCLRYQCKGNTFWDNNFGSNYSFQCLPTSNSPTYTPISTGMDDQIATFYYMESSSSDDTTTNDNSSLTSAAVQDYIMQSLKNGKHETSHNMSSTEMFAIFIVLCFSIVFLYAKRAIIF